jgi:GntR family transcriptional regulator
MAEAVMKIDPSSYIPIYEQIKAGLKKDICLRVLRPNEALPTIRDLAQELILNPNTVARAYRDLEEQGFIYTRKGKGSYVTDNSEAIIQNEQAAILNKIFDRVLEEANGFGLAPEEIRKVFEQRLAAAIEKKNLEDKNERNTKS